MLKALMTSQNKNFAYALYTKRNLHYSLNKKERIMTGEESLNEVRTLYEQKKYEEALKLIVKIESQYPDCTKAAKQYRGKVSMALLEREGVLEKFTHHVSGKLKNK